MRTRLEIARSAHNAGYDELISFVKRQAEARGLSALEMLALAANLVGKLIAMQDAAKITPAQAMEIVGKNIEQGNQEAQLQIQEPAGRA